ncbi:MAG: beta-ketoacyl synthase N-terminal-like domain-containing protein, partial [Phycisphaeraceae bacterium]|nr:beta-ketoacyl synthase N-terminal-like domain-containing protein [Phycisphaeraceae bacterium]
PETAPVIAGAGLLTPLGHSAWATFGALDQGKSLSDRLARMPADIPPVDLVRAAGGVGPVRHDPTDPVVALMERAAREAATEAQVSLNHLPAFLATSKGAVTALQAALAPARSSLDAPNPVGPAAAVALGPHGYAAAELTRRTGICVLGHHVAACASSLVALDAARRCLLAPDGPDAVLVATAEASLLPMFIHSYQRLGVLAPLTVDDYHSRPLDEQRQGFCLAEMGAAVILRRPTPDDDNPALPRLLDTAVAAEAYDLVRSAPGLPALTRLAGEVAERWQPSLVHVHAPGTADHDPAEATAVGNGENSPDLYAVKGAIGHGLGAAGLVSLVIARCCHRAHRRPPMPWLTDPVDGAGHVGPDATPLPDGSHQAVLAAGFGGHVASTVIG